MQSISDFFILLVNFIIKKSVNQIMTDSSEVNLACFT